MVSHAPWVDRAACIGTDPERWFRFDSGPHASKAEKAICETCPVRQQCLEWAMAEFLDDGIFGGLTGRERTLMRRNGGIYKPVERRDVAPHGTAAAFKRHERLGTVPCDECRVAFREYRRGEVRRRRDRKRAAMKAAV